LCILHLNVRSLPKYLHEIDNILKSRIFDIVSLNETKLDKSYPNSFYSNNDYFIFRKDKSRREKGLIVFIRKEYEVIKIDLGETEEFDIDYIYFQLKIKKQFYNFLNCYKPPDMSDIDFCDKLEDLIYNYNYNDPMVIMGDLNIDLYDITINKNFNGSNENQLQNFIKNNNMINYVDQPTRIATIYHEKTNTFTTSKTLIDVILHNNDLINSCNVIDCPFSDHRFVMVNLKIEKLKYEKKSIIARSLTSKNLLKISQEYDLIDFNRLFNSQSVNDKWIILEEELLILLNKIVPEKKIIIKSLDSFPWIDDDLRYAQFLRDTNYKKWKISNKTDDYLIYKDLRDIYDKTYNSNMIKYFKTTSPKDFKNSKKFWKFHSVYMPLKNDKSGNQNIKIIKHGEITADDPINIGNLFNNFFTSLSSTSNVDLDNCIDFSKNHFDNIKDKLNVQPNSFKFKRITYSEVEYLIRNMDNSTSAGISGLPVKLFKQLHHKICNILTNLFNDCIDSKSIPEKWKTAVVTPLYKKNGAIEDINNYRGISVLPPIGKMFERILSDQIKQHLNDNNLLFNGQYGFRSCHSCESALHEVLSDMNRILSERKIGLYFFIDFKKAFDLVPTDILIFKLKYGYGFDDNSIKLLTDYFKNRSQYVKIGNITSIICQVLLGVPQGSVLGPLLFLLFINDLPYFIKMFFTILFADDTTLSQNSDNYDNLMKKFYDSIGYLTKWCSFNKVDINWKKSEIMFITNKQNITIPEFINISGNNVKVVTEFKLLGIIIDNKLNFKSNTAKIKRSINIRLYSIQKLFQLPLAVKIQFLKTFILPYFDYCATLCIYYSKSILQKLANSYNNCIFKLINVKSVHDSIINSSEDFNKWNTLLEQYGLNGFQHRLIIRLATYIQKIFCYSNSPSNLANCFILNNDLNKSYNLRNLLELKIPDKGKYNDYGEDTFEYFFSKFINLVINEIIHFRFGKYKKYIPGQKKRKF
jgi:hypothetical protein